MFRKRFSGSLGSAPRRPAPPPVGAQGAPAWVPPARPALAELGRRAQTLPRAPSYPAPGPPVPTAAYYVDKVNGSDSNNGRLVAEGGTGPWQTLGKALAEAEAGTFNLVAASDDINIIFRNTGDGIYSVTGRVMEGGGATTLARKIRFRTHPDDLPVLFSTATGAEVATGIITMGSSNYSWERLYFRCDEQLFGSNGASFSGRGWRWVDCTQLWSGTSYSVDNHGILNFNNDTGDLFDDAEITRCRLDGNSSPHANGCTVFLENVGSRITFRDVILSNRGIGQTVYYKHPPAADPGVGGNLRFENFVIRHEGANARGVIYGGPDRVEYENGLILWESTSERALHVVTAVDSAGYAAGHANVFGHVTFWSANTGHADGGFWSTTNIHTGALSGTANSIRNSVFINSLPAIGSTVPYTHNTTLDYNLYQVTGDAAEEFSIGYATLSAWRAQYNQDVFSVEEDAILAGTADPDDYTSFALGPTSQGFEAASDGEDMGAYDMSWLSGCGADKYGSLIFTGDTTGDDGRVKTSVQGESTPANVGAGDFTVEFWCIVEVANTAPAISTGNHINWTQGNIIFDRDVFNPASVAGWGISFGNGRAVFGLNVSGSQRTLNAASADLRDGQWHHIAVQRRSSDGAMSIHVDGANFNTTGPVGSLVYPDSHTPSNSCGPGGGQSCSFSDPFQVLGTEKHDVGVRGFFGHMTELRVSNLLRYSMTAAITRPIMRFMPDANTKVLYRMENPGAGTQLTDYSGNAQHGLIKRNASSEPAWDFKSPF